MQIDRALTDHRLLGTAFGDISTWRTWLAILKATFALPLDPVEQGIFSQISGGRTPPTQRVRELWCIAGRRSGKSQMSAAIALYLALFVRYRLSRGETGMVLVIAGSMDQASTVFNYVRGFLDASPSLRKEVAAIKRYEIELKNGIIIAVHSNSFRTVRGRTLVGCVMDEVSFWRDETSATPDIETYRAVLPSLATTQGLLVGISTPYRKIGLMHQKHRDHLGADGDEVLVVPLSGRLLGCRQNLPREPPPLQIVAARAHRAPASTPRIAAESPIRRSSPSATRAESHWESPPRSSIQKFLYGPLPRCSRMYLTGIMHLLRTVGKPFQPPVWSPEQMPRTDADDQL